MSFFITKDTLKLQEDWATKNLQQLRKCMRLFESNMPVYSDALVLLVAVDIIRGIRKYAFCTNGNIERSLGHLLEANGFPAHYPKFLNPRTDGKNAVCFGAKTIKTIYHFLDGAPEFMQCTRSRVHTMVSDDLFSQILNITTAKDITSICFTLLYLTSFDHHDGKYVTLNLPTAHDQSRQERTFKSCQYSWFVSLSSFSAYLNFAEFFRVVPRFGTRVKLLEGGELTSAICPAVYFSSLSNTAQRDDVIKPIFLCNFYRQCLNSLVKEKEGIKGFIPFHFHLKPGKKERFEIIDTLQPDYVVTSKMVRTNRTIKLPFQVIEKISWEFNADNYIRTMTSPIETQDFLEDFDGKALLKILESIPNFVYAFSEQQRNLISSHHNTVVVGRSGTGKTTCAVMRMIGIRLLEVANKNIKKGIKKIRYRDLCNQSFVKMVFITASPLLARNVSKLFHRVLNYMKQLLREKENKAASVSPSSKATTSPTASPVHSAPTPTEKTPTEKQELGGEKDDFEVIEEDWEPEQPHLHRNQSHEGAKVVEEFMENFDINILTEAEKELDEALNELDIENERSEIPNTFSKVKLENFPLFLTIKEFFYLMDSLMPESFFTRNLDSIIKAGISKATGKRGFFRQKQNAAQNRLFDNILFRDSQPDAPPKAEISSDEDDIMHEEPNAPKVTAADPDVATISMNDVKNVESNDLITEVDYDDFRDVFYPQFLESMKAKKSLFKDITPAMCWSKVRNLDCSYTSEPIEKSHDARLNKVYLDYKTWKEKSGNYDINDLYNHIYRYYENDVIANNLIDFLFLDEIQDIPVHLLNYMRRFGTKFFYFSGDNAQNITKGTTFSFQELAKTYNSYKKHQLSTEFHPLTINYRSHQRILDLGNNLVFHLRMFFPEMIEFLPPEESPTDGPKPLIIPLGTNPEQFEQCMLSQLGVTRNPNTGTLSFKSSQVFITRDFKTKQELLDAHPNAIVFTILEAKGMEFEEVILYNYFSDSENHGPFLVFKQCVTTTKKDIDSMKEPSYSAGEIQYCKKRLISGHITQYTIQNDKVLYDQLKEQVLKNSFSEAGDELKLLYVAVTRARSKLIIYDELKGGDSNKHKRSYFDGMWKSLDLVITTTDPEMEGFMNFNKAERSKDKKRWVKEGIEFLQRGLYEYAEICFNSGEFDKGIQLASLCKLAANYKRDWYLLRAVNGSTEDEKKEIEDGKAHLEAKIRDLALKFSLQKWHNQAGQCYSMLGELKPAAEEFKKAGNLTKAADYNMESNDYNTAFEYYRSTKDVMGMINCLQLGGDSQVLIKLIEEVKETLPADQAKRVESIVKKHTKAILLKINNDLLYDNQEEEQVEENKTFTGLANEIKGTHNMDNTLTHSFADVTQTIAPTPTQPQPAPAKKEEVAPAPIEKVPEKEDSIKNISSDEDEEKIGSFSDKDSFQVLDVAEAMSQGAGSIEYFKSEIDEAEKLSESFLNVTLEGKKLRTDPQSAFEDLPTRFSADLNFRETKVLMNVMNAIQTMFKLCPDSKPHPAQGEDPIIEIGMLEISDSEAKAVLKLLESSGAYALRMLMERKLGYTKEALLLFVSYLFYTSQIKTNFLNSVNAYKVVSKPHFENRRLTTISFINSLHKYDPALFKMAIDTNYKECRSSLIQIVLLGYYRQIISLLKEELSIPIIVTFGEIHTLMLMKTINNQMVFDRETLLRDLLTVSGLKKLLIVYQNFATDKTIIECALNYFSYTYLWEAKTYQVEDAEETIEKFETISPMLHSVLKFMRCIVNQDVQGACDVVSGYYFSQLVKSKDVIAGLLAGCMFQIFKMKNKFLNLEKFEKTVPDLAACKRSIGELKNVLKIESVYRKDVYQFIKGVLLSFQTTLVDASSDALLYFAIQGAIIHKTSILINYPSLYSTEKMNLSFVLTAADPGLDFLSANLKMVFTLIKELTLDQPKSASQSILRMLPPKWLSNYLESFAEKGAIELQKQNIKSQMKEIRDDEMVRDSVKKTKEKQIQDLSANKPKISASSDIYARAFMTLSWKTNAVNFPCGFYEGYMFMMSQLKGLTQFSSKSAVTRSLIFYFNWCASFDKLHLFFPIYNLITKNFQDVKQILENYIDSEYSYITGNTEEFMNGKLSVFDSLTFMETKDSAMNFLCHHLLEDIAIGYALAASNGKYMVVPISLFQKRILTNPIFDGVLKVYVNGKVTSATLSENPFNTVAPEVIKDAKDFLEEYKNKPQYKNALGFMKKLVTDKPPESDSSSVVINLTKCSTADNKDRRAKNLKLYEDVLAKVETEQAQFAKLINTAKNTFKVAGATKRTGGRKSEEVLFSLTAYSKILKKILNGTPYHKILVLKNRNKPASVLLQKLSTVMNTAVLLLQENHTLCNQNQMKIKDIVDTIVMMSDTESEIIDFYTSNSSPTAIKRDDLSEYIDKIELYRERIEDIHTKVKYMDPVVVNQRESTLAEADLNSRMERIRSNIYRSYMRSRALAKQIVVLKKKADEENKVMTPQDKHKEYIENLKKQAEKIELKKPGDLPEPPKKNPARKKR
jgi:tetratricopeptide (TPR) repeat protein